MGDAASPFASGGDDPAFTEPGCPLVFTATFGLLARCLLASIWTHRSGLRSGRLSRPSSLLRPLLASARGSARLSARPDAARAPSPRRPPEISHPVFAARPPTLRCRASTGRDLAASGPLVRPWRLLAGSCSSARGFATRFFQTPPRDDALALRYPSPRSGWDEDFHFADWITCSAYHKKAPTRSGRRFELSLRRFGRKQEHNQ